MALNFPNNPSPGQVHLGVNNVQYQYDGEKWITLGTTNATGLSPVFETLSVTGTSNLQGATTVGGALSTDAITASGAIAGASYSGGTVTGTDISGSSLSVAGTADVDALEVDGPSTTNIVATTSAIDCSAGNYFTITVNGATTFSFNNVPASRSYGFTLEVTHTSGTITWPGTVAWPKNEAPELTTGTTHVFVFITDDSGSRWRGAALVDYNN